MSKSARTILEELVSFPVFGGESNLSIINHIADYLKSYGVTYHMVPNEEGTKASLHCRIGPAVDGGIILSGHTDVVPVEGQPWDTDPFVLTEKEGKLYARGSCDMKGFIACVLANVPKMLEADLKKPIYFAFSYDEEIGCLAAPDLVKDINKTYSEKPAFAIIGEPSMMIPTIGQKGICVFKTTVKGSAGHSSRIRQEVSAINESARLILWLEQKMDQLIKDGHTDDRFDPNHSSIHSGIIHGGVAHNIVCDSCSFVWDVRVIPQDDVFDILRDFEAFSRERIEATRHLFPDMAIHTEIYHPFVPALDTPEHLPIVDLVKELSGISEVDAVSYAAEAGQFAEGGFESIICGPGSIQQAHRANEFISIEQLDKGVEFISRLVEKFAKD
jgi:acetylornithine deacetylase